jgi:hypothetical protein
MIEEFSQSSIPSSYWQCNEVANLCYLKRKHIFDDFQLQFANAYLRMANWFPPHFKARCKKAVWAQPKESSIAVHLENLNLFPKSIWNKQVWNIRSKKICFFKKIFSVFSLFPVGGLDSVGPILEINGRNRRRSFALTLQKLKKPYHLYFQTLTTIIYFFDN